MKLITFCQAEGAQSLGCLGPDLDSVIDLSGLFPDMLSLIDGGEAALQSVRIFLQTRPPAIKLADVTLQAPIPVPRQIRDCMLFEKHLKQATAQFVRMKAGALAGLINRLNLIKIPKIWYQQPIYYKCNRFSVIGPGAEVIWPAYSELMDFECELAVVIGQKGKDILPENARAHIFGYTIFNDMSARDAQFQEMPGRLGPAKGKDFDTGNILGPWLVTADELPDPYDLTLIARVNGEQWGRGHSSEIHHRIEDLIAHVSASETLYPGEILGLGTVGNGCGLEHGRFLKPGDVIELEITGLGVLKNRITKLD